MDRVYIAPHSIIFTVDPHLKTAKKTTAGFPTGFTITEFPESAQTAYHFGPTGRTATYQ
jgi:hypothetical protein